MTPESQEQIDRRNRRTGRYCIPSPGLLAQGYCAPQPDISAGTLLPDDSLIVEFITMVEQLQNALRMTAASKLFAEYQQQLLSNRLSAPHQGESQSALEYRHALDLCVQADRLLAITRAQRSMV